MKKLYLFLLALLPIALLSSCSNDGDNPADVDMSVAMSNGITKVDGVYYAVEGEPFTIDAITATSVNGSATAISGVDYYLNYRLIGYSLVSPFGASVVPTKLGNNVLQLYTTVLQVDKSITMAYLEVPFVVVSSVEDIPGYDGSASTPVTYKGRISPAPSTN